MDMVLRLLEEADIGEVETSYPRTIGRNFRQGDTDERRYSVASMQTFDMAAF